MTRPVPAWKARHMLAKLEPTPTEASLISLMAAIEATVSRWANDYVLRDGIADLIVGTRQLLNGEWGDRLDMGTVDADLISLAARMDYCLDHEAFDDDCLEGADR